MERATKISSKDFEEQLRQLQECLFDCTALNPLFTMRSGAPGFFHLTPGQQRDLFENDVLELSIEAIDMATVRLLDRIRRKANSTKKEFGFDQLSIASNFLDWHNANHEEPEQRHTPLTLTPATIDRKKGVPDKFVIRINRSSAMVNPVIAHHFEKNFGIQLRSPETIDQDLENTYGRWSHSSNEVVLGNFDTHRMAIANDYEQLLQKGSNHRVLQTYMSDADLAKISDPDLVEGPTPNCKLVLPADPTQRRAISGIRNEQVSIIQGPPGTGKSQTIVNILVDAVLHGKKVLFVSEKRAALDVVRERLEKVGLGQLLMFVHHPEDDRKEVYKDLGKTIHDFREAVVFGKAEHELKRLQLESQAISDLFVKYGEDLLEEKDGYSLYELSQRRNQFKMVSELNRSAALSSFDKAKDLLASLNSQLLSSNGSAILADHPHLLLRPEIWKIDDPASEIRSLIIAVPEFTGGQYHQGRKLSHLSSIYNRVRFLHPLLTNGLLDAVAGKGKAPNKFERLMNRFDKAEKKLKKYRELNVNWRNPWPMGDVLRGLEVLENAETSTVKRWGRTYRKLIRSLKNDYDFDEHPVPPSVDGVMTNLKRELDAEEELQKVKAKLREAYGETNPEMLSVLYRDVRSKVESKDMMTMQLMDDQDQVRQLYESMNAFDDLTHHARKLWGERVKQWTIEQLLREVVRLQGAAKEIEEQAPVIRQLVNCSRDVYTVLGGLDATIEELEYSIIDREINERLKFNNRLRELDDEGLKQLAKKQIRLRRELEKANAKAAKELVVAGFQRWEKNAAKPSRQVDEHVREDRKRYKRGIRILEKEAGKKMRHIPLREAVSGDAGFVMQKVKPIWMMSPSAVSRILDLEERFDLVVFDEASQVRVEEGLPTMVRAKRGVIIGDPMQLPPSNYFHSGNVESLLDAWSGKARSFRLTWHYRSESSELIDLPNVAFYDGELEVVPSPGGRSLLSGEPPISLHYCEGAVYEHQANREEAKSVANVLRRILSTDNGRWSTGIVAFSQKQQEAIEEAIDKLASSDPVFANKLERAWDGELFEDGTSLFVRNLENVQGDERDVMIISAGYGKDPEGKFYRRFGPLNREGGEKRLNVLLTRSRVKMHIVTSMTPEDIGKASSPGVYWLKRFLRHAEIVSRGDRSPFSSVSQAQIGANPDVRTGEQVISLIPTKTDLLLNRIEEVYVDKMEVYGMKGWGFCVVSVLTD